MAGAKSGRPPTGSPRWNDREGRWEARVTLPGPGDHRKLVPMPGIAKGDEAQARKIARAIAIRVQATGAVPEASRETVNEWAVRWYAHLGELGFTTVPDIRSRGKRILDIVGTTPMADVTSDQIEDVRDALDREVRAERISWKSAFHAWSDVRCMFRDAVNAKHRSLRCRKDNPTEGVRPPEKGADKAKTVLYPDEVGVLLAHDVVPVRYRVLYAVALYTGMRAGELEALTWGDVDLVHGMISVTKAVNRKTGEVASTKTEETGDVPIEANLHPLLAAMSPGKAPTDRVLWLPPDEDRAANLRKHLERVGITRPALFASDTRNKPIWFHDTRSTHLTWRAVRGDHAAVIQAVARHASFQTTLGYIHGATLLKARVGDVFPPLPPELIERAPGAGEVSDRVSVVSVAETAKTPRKWRPQRELKTLSKLVVVNCRRKTMIGNRRSHFGALLSTRTLVA